MAKSTKELIEMKANGQSLILDDQPLRQNHQQWIIDEVIKFNKSRNKLTLAVFTPIEIPHA